MDELTVGVLLECLLRFADGTIDDPQILLQQLECTGRERAALRSHELLELCDGTLILLLQSLRLPTDQPAGSLLLGGLARANLVLQQCACDDGGRDNEK